MYYHKNLTLTFSVFQLTFVTNTFKHVNIAPGRVKHDNCLFRHSTVTVNKL